ncbi:MAG: hypothetical protein WEA54_03800 [Actinomycetota bacterium]
MALKSKNRGRGHSSRQVTRGPRFQPKAPPTPWFRRRRVQVIGAFLAGIALVVFVTWVRDGLRAGSVNDEADARAAALRRSVQEFTNLVQPVVTEVGTPVGATIDPFPRITQDLEAFLDGEADTAEIEASADATADVAADGIPKLRDIDVPGIFGDKGLAADDVSLAVNARDRLLHALQVYEESAAQALRAADFSGGAQRELAASALALSETAREEFIGGYADYVALQEAAGTFTPPAPPQQGLPPGTIPTDELPPGALPPGALPPDAVPPG